MFISKTDNLIAAGPISDEALVAKAKLGEEAAFTELWRRHSTKTYRTLRQITRHQQDAEDAFQDTSLKVYLHLKGFDGRSKFSTWVTRIAVNSALMILRKRKRYPQLSLDSEWEDSNVLGWNIPDRAPSAEALILHEELLMHLGAAVGQLKPSLRDVIDIQLADEWNNAHVARIAGLSVPATKSRLLRARAALRKTLVCPTLEHHSSRASYAREALS